MPAHERALSVGACGHAAAVRILPSVHSAAPVIIGLHGFTGSGEDFLPLRAALGKDTCTWILPDWMGHGGSDSPRNIDPYLLPSSLALIDRCRGLAGEYGPASILGYSMGGRIALHYLRHAAPLPAAVIGASPGIADAKERECRRASDREWVRLLEHSMDAFCRKWEDQAIIEPQTRLPEPLCSELAGRRRAASPSGLANALLAVGAGTLPSLWSCLGSLPPLHCLYGKKDGRFAGIAADMHKANASLHPVAIDGAGHAPHLENPGAVAAFLKRWLKARSIVPHSPEWTGI